MRHACKKGCRGPNCWQGRRLPRHTVLFDSMAPWRYSLHRVLCTAFIVLFASQAGAQCTARDVLRNHLTFKKIPSAIGRQFQSDPPTRFRCGRRLRSGRLPNSFALHNALDAAGCGIGDQAEEILARPAFTVSATKTDVELVAVSAAELGFQTIPRRWRHLCPRSTVGFWTCGSGGRSATQAAISLTSDR